MKQLFKRQKRLKWLEAITLTEQNFNDELKKSLDFDSMMGNCSEVGLWLDSRQAIEMGAELVKRVLKLQKLTIRASFDKTDPVIPHQELNDTINAPGLITGTVFRHMAPFENSKPLEVSTLFVEEIALSYCRSKAFNFSLNLMNKRLTTMTVTYCRVIDMSKLHTLKIHNCSGADSLLVELSSSSRLPHGLKVLEFKHEDEDRECRGLGAIESFLCMISGLENLVIDLLTTRNLPQVNSITRHAKTLKLLGIHATNNDREEHVYDYPSFDKIFSSCTELEQLSIAAPSCEITRIATSQPDSFKRSLTGSSSVMNNLRTLQITTFPSEQSVRHCLPRSIYEHLLQAEATSLFKTRDNSKALQKLNIVAWGVIDRLHFRCYNNDTIFIYGRGKLLHPDGKESPMASLVPSALHGYVESRSDVIDFIHHKYHGFSPQDDDDDI